MHYYHPCLIIISLSFLNLRVSSRFSAPLSLLYDCAGPVMQCSEAFTELVQKCIWKKTRMIAANIARIEMGPILQICNDFFNSYPRNYWKNKPNDKPLRTVKTVVVTLVQQAPERVSFILRIHCIYELETFQPSPK